MFNVHCFLDDKRTGPRTYSHLPRIGDTIRFDENRFGTVTEVIWCMDEPTVDGQRVNIRLKSLSLVSKSSPARSVRLYT